MTKLCKDCANREEFCCKKYCHGVGGFGGPRWCRDVRKDSAMCGPEAKDFEPRAPDLVWGDNIPR